MGRQEREGKQRVVSLSELGVAFGVSAPVAPAPRTEGTDFYSLPILKRLQLCGETRSEGMRRNHDRRERVAGTIGDVLQTDREERVRLGIRTHVEGPIGKDRRLVIQEEPLLTSAKVRVAFPTGFQGKHTMIDINDILLTAYEGIPAGELQGLVDEVRQEPIFGRHARLRLNIKNLDTAISDQKKYQDGKRFELDHAQIERQVRTSGKTWEMDRLNRLKAVAMWDFLQTSLDLEDQHPHLLPQFVIRESDTPNLLEVVMWSPSDKNVLQRTLVRTTPPRLVDEVGSFSTNMLVEKLVDAHSQYTMSPDSSPSYIEAGHHTWDLLQQTSIRERERGTTVYKQPK